MKKKKDQIEVNEQPITPTQIHTNTQIGDDYANERYNEKSYINTENSNSYSDNTYYSSNNNTYMSSSLNDLLGSDRTSAIELAKECVGKEAYSEKVLELGVAGAEKWAFEEAKSNNFKKIEFVKEPKKTSTTSRNIDRVTYKSNEKVENSNNEQD